MAETTIRDEFDCTADTYWDKCHFNADFNRELYLETLKFPGWKMLEQKTDGPRRTRRVRIDPPVTGLPGPVKKLVGDSISYVEEGTHDQATGRYAFKITPSTLPDKTNITGEVWCEKLDGDRIARICKIRVEVKVFAVGGLIEEKVMTDLKASYAKAAPFTNGYVKKFR